MRWLPLLRGQVLHWHGETLAAIISLQNLKDALRILGYPAVTLFIMVESSGIPFPGETMLLLASFASATFEPQLLLPIVIVCAALGAIIGDNIGFYVGAPSYSTTQQVAFIWAIVYGCIGFFVGRIFQNDFAQVEHIASVTGWIGAAAVAVVILTVFIIFRIRRARRLRTETAAKTDDMHSV